MQLKGYKDWTIFTKIISLSLLTWLVLVLATVFALSPFIRTQVMQERKDAIRYLVDEASTLLANYQKQVEAGALAKEEAQKRAAADVKSLRYGGKQYFWINDLQARLIAHPLRPENEGKDMSSFQDADGRPIPDIHREDKVAPGRFGPDRPQCPSDTPYLRLWQMVSK
jgi:methyl-accepting chemotaxis protein